MDDHPGQAVRKKRDASMRVAFELVKRGEAQAVVSAGNSGAMLACGLFVLGRMKGLDRPGIAVTLPTLERLAGSPLGQLGKCVLLDTGANIDCKPQTLAQFAVLGSTFASVRKLTPRARPRVGLLANGEESSKGTPLLREAHLLLSRNQSASFDYVGFVEGRDIFQWNRPDGISRSGLDVVVTDGFTGNVVLKTAEGAGRLLADILRQEATRSTLVKLGALLMRPALTALKSIVDVDGRGGAPLLGCKGVVIICHGRSSARAISRAIEVAEEQVAAGLIPALSEAIRSHGSYPSSDEPAPAPNADPKPKDSDGDASS
jgi:glycerol-3-phosphate acyltransferase PlsX